MPIDIVTVREPLVTAFGFTVVAVDLYFLFDPDDCSYEFKRSALNRNGIKALGSGINYFLSVVELGETRLEECEVPPNTCRKVITLGIELSRSFSSTVLGTATARTPVVRMVRQYATDCLQACCS